ncbi:unnamed protein product [Lactuca saligna]|uniref:Non-haem dioxygenase N-terminal domain-containing protein n=1 Tax=Lactuca saligna TaxID=75948 RepID=A0AA35ZJA0_LACSI|nr:unnamed protein product [Lactuca saligna]
MSASRRKAHFELWVIGRAALSDQGPGHKGPSTIQIPVIDLQSTHIASMMEMIREASANLGIFQAANHGIPVSVMDEAVQGVRRFHEQDDEVKKGFYTRDLSSTLVYISNYDLYSSPALNWRDIFFFIYGSVTSAA